MGYKITVFLQTYTFVRANKLHTEIRVLSFYSIIIIIIIILIIIIY